MESAPFGDFSQYDCGQSTNQRCSAALGGWLVEDFRHFHYVQILDFFWSVSAMDTGIIAPLYVFLSDHFVEADTYRDDDRCQKKIAAVLGSVL
jgi:hypothetical protein